ncbi:carboxypeptidase PM20D1 [Bacillus mesophilus]|uniref:M20/M25/M40 family metallo-hydrolase n=1 Tax=Bacillus mesophilus TaxID=1808955 RepID=A0A6M0Q7X0_9BACI|nr:M20 family peptidase [Bacillus mesophilus]MBM7661695.1 carboxypeptidase PM20D1 [Bacillus mesophilus]NEY72357.1 M20/M25/M40 family metallo-hydrolase [Bacillus mesophilus]
MEIGVTFCRWIDSYIFIVTAFNALTVKSKQPTPNPNGIVLDDEAAVQRFSTAITYQTISYEDRTKFDFDEFDKFITFLQESYPTVHEQLELEKINGYALVYKWTGSDSTKKPIGLASHYDVVPVLDGTEGNWEQGPFTGAIEDGIIWGRGTLDDKIGVIGILEALEKLLTEGYEPNRDMYFMFGFDEEIGGEEGAKAIAETLKARGVTFDFVLDEGGAIVENMVPGVEKPVGVVGISEKGSATVELTIEGSGGHSSQPKNHTNIGRIANAIAKLEDTQFKGDLRGPGEDLFEFVAPEMNVGMKYVFANKFIFEPIIENILLKQPASAALIRTTIAPTIFHAGEQSNVLPEKASAIINLRLMPGDSLDYVKNFIEETISDDDIKVTITGREASKVSSIDGWQFKAIQQAARNVNTEAVIAPYLMVAGSDAKHYDHVSDNTYRFLPVQITSEDLNRMHGTNEHVSIENYLNAIRFYIEIIKESNK